MRFASHFLSALAVLVLPVLFATGCSREIIDVSPNRAADSRATVSGDNMVLDVTVDTTHVYWVADSVVKRQPKAGGHIDVLAARQDMPYAIAVDDAFVYWANFPYILDLDNDRPGSVVKVPKAGGTPVVLATDADQPCQIAVDATSVYYTTCGGAKTKSPYSTLKVVPKEGGTATTLLSNAVGASFTVSDAGIVVVLDRSLALIDKTTGATISVRPLGSGVEDATLGPGGVFFVGKDVGFAAFDSSAESVLVQLDSEYAGDVIRVDGTNAYYFGDTGVEKVPLVGGAVTTMLRDLDLTTGHGPVPYGMAMDDTTVYIAANDLADNVGLIYRLPK